MRSALLYLSMLLSITSCSRYQYYSLASNDTPVDTTHRFVTENDTCRISYDFSGANGQLSISIYNKTDQPLQVDWKRSALVIGDSSVALFDQQAVFNGEVERNRYNVRQDISGTLSTPEPGDFIPPGAAITKQGKMLATRAIKLEGPGQEIRTEPQKMKLQSFTRETSPLSFRIYLTLVFRAQSFVLDSRFYTKQVIETYTPLNSPGAPGNFYTKHQTGFGSVTTVVLLTGLAVLALVGFSE